MLADNERGYNSKPLHERTGYLNFLLRSSYDTLKGLGAFVGKRLKELYCITEAPLDVLKVELLFIIVDLNFPIEQRFCLC